MLFERYVNFEFYETFLKLLTNQILFERYVNFEFYETISDVTVYKICLRDM